MSGKRITDHAFVPMSDDDRAYYKHKSVDVCGAGTGAGYYREHLCHQPRSAHAPQPEDAHDADYGKPTVLVGPFGASGNTTQPESAPAASRPEPNGTFEDRVHRETGVHRAARAVRSPAPAASERERLWADAQRRAVAKYAVAESGCWVWTGALDDQGYGKVSYGRENRRHFRAHRLLYEMHRGRIGRGLVIDHICKNKACVNPDHLEAVPQRINVLRGSGPTAANATKTHCPRGHELKEKAYGRYCPTCNAEQQRERRRRSVS